MSECKRGESRPKTGSGTRAIPGGQAPDPSVGAVMAGVAPEGLALDASGSRHGVGRFGRVRRADVMRHAVPGTDACGFRTIVTMAEISPLSGIDGDVPSPRRRERGTRGCAVAARRKCLRRTAPKYRFPWCTYENALSA